MDALLSDRGNWTPEEIESVRELALEGYSGSQIAGMLWQRHGTSRTRSAVCSICSRYKFKLKNAQRPPSKAKKPLSGAMKRKMARAKALGVPVEELPVQAPVRTAPPPPAMSRKSLVDEIVQEALRDGRGKPFLEARGNECLYPVYGQGASMIVCAAPRLEGSSYCPTCYLVTHIASDRGIRPLRRAAVQAVLQARAAA